MTGYLLAWRLPNYAKMGPPHLNEMRALEMGSALMLKRRERGLATTALLVALVLPGAAWAGDSTPAPAPPQEGAVQSVTRKIESAGVARNAYVHPLAKMLGVATDPAPAADFVVKARPAGEEDYIPVGHAEAEHSIKPKTPAQLKAMEAEFDQVKTRHDALRATFPPAVKAVADAEAAKAAKANKPKKTPAPANVDAKAQ